jgi:hypothetical protein
LECEVRVGVAETIQRREGEGRVLPPVALKGSKEGLDGILGIGPGSSVALGLRKAGVRGFKTGFEIRTDWDGVFVG